MDRQKSSVRGLTSIVAGVALVFCCRGVDFAFSDDGADLLATSPNIEVVNLNTNDGDGSPGNSSGNQHSDPGNQNNNGQGGQSTGDAPPCVPPAGGLLVGVGIASILLSPPCS